YRLAAEILMQLSIISLLVSVAVRFRRSRGTERQQLKWIAYSGGVVLVAGLSGEILFRLFLPAWYPASTIVLSLAILTVPLAIAVAILRHRLYDIDRIISRTVAYGAVTAVLVAAYVGVVFVLRLVVPGGNQLVVAASTLTVAALFNPLRRRVQVIVDRRFNRSRYDAAQVVDAFGARIRSEAGMQALANDLLAVARETMEPSSASLWLRDKQA
ncbi:MAG TPA: hypothetical protein VHL52_01275, partial [Acidimicrobiia bacterium]|nr:hypothetical protein [Acidimicrobiia bacterium]